MSRQSLNELVEKMITIRDSYGMSMDDRDAMAEACNVIHHNVDALADDERSGVWVEEEDTYPGSGLSNYKCSVCGRTNGAWAKDMPAWGFPNYCWWCGARLQKGGTE